MSNPYLIALAANIADYMVTNEYPFGTTVEDENGDIVYTNAAQETFNKRYVDILDLLEDSIDGKVLRIQTDKSS